MRASYRRLWEAATGAHETMSLKRMEQKAEQMERELAQLKTKMGDMHARKQALLEPLTAAPHKDAATVTAAPQA